MQAKFSTEAAPDRDGLRNTEAILASAKWEVGQMRAEGTGCGRGPCSRHIVFGNFLQYCATCVFKENITYVVYYSFVSDIVTSLSIIQGLCKANICAVYLNLHYSSSECTVRRCSPLHLLLQMICSAEGVTSISALPKSTPPSSCLLSQYRTIFSHQEFPSCNSSISVHFS